MRKLSLLPFGVILLLGCGPIGKTASTDLGSAVLDQPQRFQKACYQGTDHSECFDTIDLTNLPDQKDLYIYGDPTNDPTFPKNFNSAQYARPQRILDLRTIQNSTWISPHFQKFEILPFDQARGYFGLFSPSALSQIEVMRQQLGRPIYITSGYRSPGRNSQLAGAAKWSRHTYGDAIDFKVDGLSYKKISEFCSKAGASFFQLYSDHIHCDWRDLPLSAAFYSSNAVTSDFSPWAQKLSGHVQIEARLDESSASLKTISFAASMPQEDEGELAFEWNILLPDGHQVNSFSPVAKVKILSGTYRVRVRIGGSVISESSFTQR